MSIFSSIVNKIVGYATTTLNQKLEGGQASTAAVTSSDAVSAAGNAPTSGSAPTASMVNSTATGIPTASIEAIDVNEVLSQMANQTGGGGNWQSSIVDLLKLLNLDPSLSSRKSLANELNVHVGADGSAEENIALHKAVMQKIEQNGGKVPANLKG